LLFRSLVLDQSIQSKDLKQRQQLQPISYSDLKTTTAATIAIVTTATTTIQTTMATLAETYICHVGNVLDLLLQDKDLDTESHSFLSPNPLPLEFVDASTPQYIHKVDAALQSLVQKMFRMEQELAWHRKHFKALHPTATALVTDITLSSPILTTPVDSLSPPGSASSHWSDGNWEFVNHTATHTSVRTDRTLPHKRSLPPQTIDTPVPELGSGALTPPTLGATLTASHSNASENVAVCLLPPADLNSHIPGSLLFLHPPHYSSLSLLVVLSILCLIALA
jgi:hypothetical protein